MAEPFTSYSVENDAEFRAALRNLGKKAADLTIPLTLIAKDFYKSEQAIFKLGGPGQYPDLAPKTKEQKQKEVGFIYPILKRSGRLAKSVTTPNSKDSINQIVNKQDLIIGTKTPYGIFHQSDDPRSVLPLRKFLFIGPEAPRFAIGPTRGRLERWLGILDGYMQAINDKA